MTIFKNVTKRMLSLFLALFIIAPMLPWWAIEINAATTTFTGTLQDLHINVSSTEYDTAYCNVGIDGSVLTISAASASSGCNSYTQKITDCYIE